MAANQHSAKHGNSGTRDMPALSMRAAIVPSSIDAEKRTVELVWTTGARVMRGFFERYWEELSVSAKHVRMGRLSSGTAPLLNAHNGYDLGGVIGVVEKAWLKNKEGGARVRFAKAEDDPEADQIFRKVMDGIIRNVSVGYRVHKLEKVEDGADQIPVYRATDWEPYEISMVPMGADAGAGVRAEGADTNPCEVIGLAYQERRMDEDEDEKTPAPAPKPKTEERAIDEAALRKEAMTSERKRIADIQSAARALALDDEFAKRHIDAGTEMDEFRKLAIDERASKAKSIVDPGGRVDAVPGGDDREKWQRGASAWLMTRAGVASVVAEAAKKRGETVALDPGEFRGLSFVELARQALERNGVRTAGMDKMTMIGKALTMRSSGYATTGDFPVLLENTLHKVLLSSYGMTADTWSLFCAVGSVSDFRAHNRYRLGSFGRLQTVAEHAEYKNQSIPDGEKESITAATKGSIISLSRQAMINDDMGAFSRLAIMLGRAARLSVESDVYDAIKSNSGLGPTMGDGNVLFHSSHANLGTASVIGVAALDADRIVMAEQIDPSGNEYLDLRPEILLVPIGLGAQARVLNEAQYDIDAIDAGTDEQNKFMKPNAVAGLFRTIVDTPRLSGTRRYLLASPTIAPVFEVAFLDGQQEPFMELQDGWRIDGAEWKIRLDYGVAAIDYRGAVTNVGAT
jgi:HK97 family phage prohead protease